MLRGDGGVRAGVTDPKASLPARRQQPIEERHRGPPAPTRDPVRSRALVAVRGRPQPGTRHRSVDRADAERTAEVARAPREEDAHPGEERLLDAGPDDPRCYSWILSHLFGTARMAARASAGVVGHDFAVHGVPNLVVADSSVFPTNLGVNPQHAIMAVARLCAERLSERRN